MLKDMQLVSGRAVPLALRSSYPLNSLNLSALLSPPLFTNGGAPSGSAYLPGTESHSIAPGTSLQKVASDQPESVNQAHGTWVLPTQWGC